MAYNTGTKINPYAAVLDTAKQNISVAGATPAPNLMVAQPVANNNSISVAGATPTSSYKGSSIVDYLTSTGQSSNFTSRTALAKQYGITGYQGSSQQNTDLLNKMRGTTISSPSAVPSSLNEVKTSPIMGVDSTLNQTDEQAKQAAIANKAVEDSVNNADTSKKASDVKIKTIQEKTKTLDKSGTQKAGSENTALKEALSAAQDKYSTQGERQLKLQEEAGIKKMKDQLNDLNSQMAALSAQYDDANEQIQAGTGLSTTIGGKAGQLQRQKAVKLSGLAGIAEAIIGNITSAQATIKDTIDLEYEPIKQEIDNLKFQLDLNYKDYDKAQKEEADAFNIQLAERERLLNEETNLKTNIGNIMIEAAKGGADNQILQDIMASGSYEQAIVLAKDYLLSGSDMAPKKIGVDSLGNDLFFDPKNNKVVSAEQLTTPTSSSSGAFFTDANGTNWNIAGWAANDASKQASMQNIANQIGKVDDSNIDQKVAQFTPGLTADMIKQTSQQTGVSWEALMAMVSQESTGGTSNVAVKNNNFGGLTFNNQEWIKPYGGAIGTARPSAEGGNYIKFPTKQDGLNAMGALMAQYGTVTPDSSGNLNNKALEIIIGSGKFTKDQKNSITNAIKNGEDSFTVIKNQAKGLMTGENQTDIEKFEVINEQLISLDSLMQEYYNNGGKTNIFTGNIEKTINKLGEVSDPKLVSIAVNIASSLQAYRNAVSGTAYSEQEGRDIAAIFPGINKSSGLNKAIIDGRLKSVNNTIDAKYRGVLGKTYDELKKISVPEVVNKNTVNIPDNLLNDFTNSNSTSQTSSLASNINKGISNVINPIKGFTSSFMGTYNYLKNIFK